eukprot:TRINITY_DN4583_c0_g1_i2.p1 TRINITY_DN4583_c0_g1~~TRINITY_DN4583_c0_g1_i2.p1  ORF type:complete len:947 (+),score=280.63 TRINITY_DN4583_c0_g1_i2:129-2969(+)
MSSFTESWGRKLKEFQNEESEDAAPSKAIEISVPLKFSEASTSSSSASSLAESPSFLNTFKKNLREKFKGEKPKPKTSPPPPPPLNDDAGSTFNTGASSSSLDLSEANGHSIEGLNSPLESKLSHSLSEQYLPPSTEPEEDSNETHDLKTPTDDSLKDQTIRRSKFTFSFRSSPNKPPPSNPSSIPAKEPPDGTSENEPPSTPSQRSVILQKIKGLGSPKFPVTQNNNNNNGITPVSMKQLEEPSELICDEQFTELIPEEEDTIERGIEANELLNISDFPPNFTQLPKPQTLFLKREEDLREESQGSSDLLSRLHFFSILPIIIVLLVQILPVPNWITGFLTGVLISVPSAFYLSVKLFQDGETLVSPTDPKEFIVHPKSHIFLSRLSSASIFIDEEIKRKSVWMNIWPSKYGVYDPLTYDVRWTVSVLVELYGYWIEMRFPRKNIPLRRMHSEQEPDLESMNFFEHQVIDLTTAEICLMPDNLPAKWMWSKKYPIQIKTFSKKKQTSTEGPETGEDHKVNGKPAKTQSDEDSSPEDDEEEDENQDSDVRTYYLFARTGREKEEWYSRFRAAANFMKDWQNDNPNPGSPVDRKHTTFKQMELKFKGFMEDYHQAKNAEEARSKMTEDYSSEESNEPEALNKKNIVKEQLAFINIFGARMWFDLHKSQAFIDFLRQKITRKLLKIKIAQYFEEVSVTTLDLGNKLPQILNASLPWQNEHGLWVDLDLEYHGVCEATVETKGIRFPSTKDEGVKEENESRHMGSLIDSDEADSAEEDDDIPENFNNYLEGADIFMDDKGAGQSAGSGTSAGSSYPGRDGLRSRMFESILKSSVVARMAESDWVKKNITGKNITLKLQLHSLKGILILNFPPPPSDRVWYGFRSPPQLDITLKPYFGGKNLSKLEGTFSTIMRLLEKRLKQEFMKVLVYPNMDDEVLSFMDHVPYSIGR